LVLRKELTLNYIPNKYIKLEKLLKSIINKEGAFARFYLSLVAATKKGLKKFNNYYNAIKKNNIY
jgi:hypothetical protein